MRQKPTVLAREIVASSRLFRVEELQLRFANGVERTYERLVGKGTGYGANLLGKIKMWVQSVTVCVILASLTYFSGSAGFIELRQWLIWATVVVTTGSLAVYLVQAKDILAEQSRS